MVWVENGGLGSGWAFPKVGASGIWKPLAGGRAVRYPGCRGRNLTAMRGVSEWSPAVSCIPSGCPVGGEPGPVAPLVPRAATG